jgi:hypothetical protein
VWLGGCFRCISFMNNKNRKHTQKKQKTKTIPHNSVAVTKNAAAIASDDEVLISRVKGTGYAQIKTSLGDLNVELYCQDAPMACLNFIMLAKKGVCVCKLYHAYKERCGTLKGQKLFLI